MSSAQYKPLCHSLFLSVCAVFLVKIALVLLLTKAENGTDPPALFFRFTLSSPLPVFLFLFLFFFPSHTDTPLNLTLFTNSHQARLAMTFSLWLALFLLQGSRLLFKTQTCQDNSFGFILSNFLLSHHVCVCVCLYCNHKQLIILIWEFLVRCLIFFSFFFPTFYFKTTTCALLPDITELPHSNGMWM